MRTAEPQKLPVDIGTARQYLGIDEDDDDSLVRTLVASAGKQVEKFCSRSLITQTWRRSLDSPPRGDIVDLPFPPLQSVTSVTTYDQANDPTVYGAGNYEVDTDRSRIYLNVGAQWPTGLRARRAVEIVFVTGYGTDDGSVPEDLQEAILQLATHNWTHRGDEPASSRRGGKGVAMIPKKIRDKLLPYVWRLI